MSYTKATALCLTAVLALSGCRAAWQPLFRQQQGGQYSQAQLRADLVGLANSYDILIPSAADEISRDTDAFEIRRNLLLWQMDVLPRVRRLAFLPDAKEGYLALLLVSVGMRHYFTEGEGRDLFGAQQGRAVEVSETLEREAFAIGSNFLNERQRRDLHAEVDRLVRENPIRGTFSPESFVNTVAEASDPGGSFAWVANVPMVPMRALTGVSDGAQAIHEFNATAQYMAEVVASLPQTMRWQSELLLFEVEQHKSVLAGLAGWEALAESSQRLAAAAEKLPDDFRAEISRLIEQIRLQHDEIRLTMKEVRESIAGAERAIGSAGEVAEPMAILAKQVGLAGASWTEALREIRAMQNSGDDATSESDGFDVQEYESAAREIRDASAEIRDLVAEVHGLVESRGLSTVVDDLGTSVTRAEASGRALVDLAAWRVFQLLLALFVILWIHRFVTTRVLRA